MHIAVVAISEKTSSRLRKIADAVAGEFRAMGHDVELFGGLDSRLSMLDFLVICSEPRGIGSDIGTKLSEQLARGGRLTGKRSMALLVRSGLFPQKALGKLMTAVEKEGLIVTMGEIVANERDSAAAARDAPLVRG